MDPFSSKCCIRMCTHVCMRVCTHVGGHNQESMLEVEKRALKDHIPGVYSRQYLPLSTKVGVCTLCWRIVGGERRRERSGGGEGRYERERERNRG